MRHRWSLTCRRILPRTAKPATVPHGRRKRSIFHWSGGCLAVDYRHRQTGRPALHQRNQHGCTAEQSETSGAFRLRPGGSRPVGRCLGSGQYPFRPDTAGHPFSRRTHLGGNAGAIGLDSCFDCLDSGLGHRTAGALAHWTPLATHPGGADLPGHDHGGDGRRRHGDRHTDPAPIR